MIIENLAIVALSIIIVIELAWIFRPTNLVEKFQDDFPTEFPATDQTEMTLENEDNGLDIPWIASWSPADKRARRGHNCNVTTKQIGPHGTMILTTTKSCEDGLPHTRPGDRIYIPDNISTVERDTVLRHELVHIYQRRNPEAWADFYRKSWSYAIFDDPPSGIPQNLVDGRRSNPDTASSPWACWFRRWWTVPIYKDAYNPRVRDTTVFFWDSWKNEITDIPPQEWSTFFGTPGQSEHPHEISACMIVANNTDTEAGRRLMTWWTTQGIYI